MTAVENIEVRRRRWPWYVGVAVLLVAVGAAASWALVTVLRPADDPLAASTHTAVAVAQGEVGSSLRLNTVAEWKPVPNGTNQAVGVVTGIQIKPGDEVSTGATLYSVNLRPVTVAEGQVPAFRPIDAGAEGSDVAQLQRMLGARGFYSGPADGDAGSGTVSGIKKWQESLGLKGTGVVQLGDVIFVPKLPARVALDEKVLHRGATLVGGEEVLRGLPASPVFELPVTEAQAGMIPAGTPVEITSPSGEVWPAVAGEVTRDEDSGTVTIAVMGEGGVAPCGAQCSEIPPSGQLSLSAQIVTVPTTSGLVVPSSALVTTADGKTVVITPSGKRVPVTVKSSAKGMSVVEGINEGVEVRVPAKDDQQ